MNQWQIWVDRGGIFTDIVAKNRIGSTSLLKGNDEVLLSTNEIFEIKTPGSGGFGKSV